MRCARAWKPRDSGTTCWSRTIPRGGASTSTIQKATTGSSSNTRPETGRSATTMAIDERFSARLPAPLQELLRAHRDRYWVHYGPDANSDHGPMAYLALVGLGASMDEIERHAERYTGRLDLQRNGHSPIDVRSYPRAIGRIGAYPALTAFFDREIDERGFEATLSDYLPSLASGWVRDAFHALIRLGYGIEFGIASEIAAGLAYLAAMGPDPRLDDAAKSPQRRATARMESVGVEDPLAAARDSFRPEHSRGNFDQRYQSVMSTGVIAGCMPEPTGALRRAAHAMLGVFDSTHGFVALPLLTSSHAIRLCAPFIGAAAPGLLWAGAIAGYLAIGAPPPRTADLPRATGPDLPLRDPEHLIKVAWSAQSQRRAFDDPAFTSIVESYLDGADPLQLR